MAFNSLTLFKKDFSAIAILIKQKIVTSESVIRIFTFDYFSKLPELFDFVFSDIPGFREIGVISGLWKTFWIIIKTDDWSFVEIKAG